MRETEGSRHSRSEVKVRISKINAPIVANQVLASASAIFSWAIKEELAGIKINPCAKVDRNDTKERERILSDSEISKFWTAFDDVGLVEGAALKVILLTGQRPGEVIGPVLCHMSPTAAYGQQSQIWHQFKTCHCHCQAGPMRVETGQYPSARYWPK